MVSILGQSLCSLTGCEIIDNIYEIKKYKVERTASNSKISVTGKYLGAFFFVKVVLLPVEPKAIEISLS